MFIIPVYIRFALIALCLIGGTIAAFFIGFWWAFPFLLAGIILLVGYVLMGTVASASQMLQNQQFDAADQQLNLTFFPQYLFKINRSIFYMLKGTIAQQKNDLDAAMGHLEMAQKIGLPSDNERAIALLSMMAIHAQKKRLSMVKTLLHQVKELRVTDASIKEQIKLIDKQMSQAGTGPQQSMQGGYMPGGKRPRPKMR